MPKKNAATKTDNVITFRTPDFELVYHRSHAGWIALDKTIDRLEAVRKRTDKESKKTLAAAVDAYAGSRPHEEKATEAIRGMAEVNRLSALTAALRDAALECRGAADRASSPQGDMFDPGKGQAVPGMGWASPATSMAIYSCLLTMDKAGEKLDPYQRDLLVDLGGAGLDAMDFGVDASEAVESEGSEAEPEDPNDDDDYVGFG